MKTEETDYEGLYAELTDYERNGICLLLDGRHVSPIQVVKACMAREAGSYMRDYEMNTEGNIESLSFTDISRENNVQS